MGKNKKRFKFESLEFFVYLWEKRFVLAIVTLVAAVLSAIVSFLITPMYKSSVVLFPASAHSISKTLFSENIYGNEDNLQFGSEEEGEQLMQVLYSEEIREKVINKYNLVKHYDIDPNSKYWKTRLYDAYKSNVKFKRTEYMSIIIEVLDKSPDTAAYIANEVCNQIDTVYSRMQRERAQKSLFIVEKEYNNMLKDINTLQDTLSKIRSLGILNYDAQSAAMANRVSMTDKKAQLLAKYGGTYQSLSKQLEAESQRLSVIKKHYLEAKVDADYTVPRKFILDMAYKSDKKASPKRMLIVLISSLSAFFTTLLLILIRDSIRAKEKE